MNSDGLQTANCAEVWWCCSINISQDSTLGQSDQCGNLKAIRGDPAGVVYVVCVCVRVRSRCDSEETPQRRESCAKAGSEQMVETWRVRADCVGKHPRQQALDCNSFNPQWWKRDETTVPQYCGTAVLRYCSTAVTRKNCFAFCIHGLVSNMYVNL